MKYDDIDHLKRISNKARQQIVNLTTKGGCFLGSALSCLDIITYLYERFLILEDKDRDYFFLSKGHAVPALYSVLSIQGIIDINWVESHLSPYSDFYYHPNINISGVDFHAGSLGHLPSVALGVALDMKLKNSTAFSVVLVGDGELNEGSVWETFLIAGANKLSNYIVIIDRNRIQANMKTESLIPLEPLNKKLEAFGFDVYEVDGHDFEEMERVFDRGLFDSEKPHAIVAHTVRGKGISRFENRIDKWFVRLTEDEADEVLRSMNIENEVYQPLK
ncbi:MAG: thiamine pyrophosphate-dependent enzyme [Thermodesulfovibrionales bacterium]|nr:thiamine pyrophosphate-dependent enzyme [Thermodesulfovibrionales bacterium]